MSAGRGALTCGQIVAAAIELADSEGVGALSMRKLAAAQGVTPMSFYNHVANKDALIDLMLGRVVAEVRYDHEGPWKSVMRQRALARRDVLLRHPWAVSLLMTRIVMDDAVLQDSEVILGCLIRAGFSYKQADWARNAIDSHVYGYTVQELNYPVQPEQYRAAAAQYLPMIDAQALPYSHGAALAIIDGDYDGLTSFEFGLDVLLDGIERWRSGALQL